MTRRPRPARSTHDRPIVDVDDLPEGSTAGRDWWLRLQIGLGLAGGAAWFVGALVKQDFLAGAGCGLLVAALVLRLGRTKA